MCYGLSEPLVYFTQIGEHAKLQIHPTFQQHIGSKTHIKYNDNLHKKQAPTMSPKLEKSL